MRSQSHGASQEGIIARHAEQRAASHEHAGDGAGIEGQLEPLGQTFRGRLRRTDIGSHRNQHAGITGRTRKHRTDQEADSRQIAEKDKGKDKDDHADHGDGGVLALEVGRGPFLNRCGDFLHTRIARAGLHQTEGLEDAIQQAKYASRDGQHQSNIHNVTPVSLYLRGAQRLPPHFRESKRSQNTESYFRLRRRVPNVYLTFKTCCL